VTITMAYSQKPLRNRSVSEFDLLTGYWKGKAGEDTIEEYWLPETNANKLCVFRWIRNGSIYIYEIVALIERDGEIHMLLRHFDKNFIAWEEKEEPRDFVVTDLSGTSVRFVDSRNPKTGFLQYATSEKNILRFSDHEPDGSVSFELIFQRVQ
jgi:hypothetical protein